MTFLRASRALTKRSGAQKDSLCQARNMMRWYGCPAVLMTLSSIWPARSSMTSLGEETSSWSYRHDRDLTGFIDGSENPTLLDAPAAALLPEGVPGAAGTVLLLQKWKHKAAEWEALPIDRQERIMGRTKLDSIELENKPADSHVARTDQDEFGHIF